MDNLIEKAKAFGESVVENNGLKAGYVEVSEIGFYPELREYCKMNACGNYGQNHMCPPIIGTSEELIARAKEYDYAIVMQGIYELEDSYDFEGMMAGQDAFKGAFNKISEEAKKSFDKMLILSAGGCQVCSRCAAKDNLPCRFPDKAYASLETYTIQVSRLAQQVGMKYINGENTVTYFGGLLLKK